MLQNTINAITLSTFSVGNIIGTEIFQPKDAPDYIPGKIAIMVLLTVQLFISFLLRWINQRLNIKKAQRLAEEKERRGWTDEDVQKERERHAFMDLTDKQYVFQSPSFLLRQLTRCIQEYVLRIHDLSTTLSRITTKFSHAVYERMLEAPPWGTSDPADMTATYSP